jgi:glycosyltransferase involved in cell wall biosynthesis
MGRSFGRILDAERPDVVNTHNLAGLSVAAMREARRRNLPLVHTLHDQYLLCVRSTGFKNEHNCVEPCAECRICGIPRKRNASYADVVIGVSNFILRRHEQFGYFASSKKRVVYNSASETKTEARPLESPRSKLRFGFLGQIRSTKGLHLLVDAFMSEFSGDADLWIAGRGDEAYEAKLRSITANRPEILWLGFVDPARLLDHVDVVVVPSIWNDTAPLVVLEALGRGIPVLGARRGGIPEFITDNTGWLCDPENHQEFRRALRRCIEYREHLPAMAKAAMQQAAKFDLQRFVQGYLDAYQEAIVHAQPEEFNQDLDAHDR